MYRQFRICSVVQNMSLFNHTRYKQQHISLQTRNRGGSSAKSNADGSVSLQYVQYVPYNLLHKCGKNSVYTP